MFTDLRQEELLYLEGGKIPGFDQIVRIICKVGEGCANLVTGYVEGCKELSDTCYSAGQDFGEWLSKYF